MCVILPGFQEWLDAEYPQNKEQEGRMTKQHLEFGFRVNGDAGAWLITECKCYARHVSYLNVFFGNLILNKRKKHNLVILCSI